MSSPRIVMLGDSLTAGYGLAAPDALPVRLAVALDRLGVAARVINAGVSGDTSADGLRRVERAVSSDCRLCIVALGANDMMQRIPVERVRANLGEILEALKRRSIPALLCGMRAPPWFGPYARAFDALFGELGAEHRVPVDPFLLEGVALDPRFSLADRIHPNAAGIDRVARRLAPTVARLLELQSQVRPS